MILAFLDVERFAEGGVRGLVLVTDERTRPLEFRVTEKVAPDALQRSLCGAVLDEHVLGDLCGAPLLGSLRERPDVVIVREQALLALQDLREEPVVWLGRDESVEGGVVLGHQGDPDGEILQRARAELGPVAQRYDLLEPFERMAVAAASVPVQAVEARG